MGEGRSGGTDYFATENKRKGQLYPKRKQIDEIKFCFMAVGANEFRTVSFKLEVFLAKIY